MLEELEQRAKAAQERYTSLVLTAMGEWWGRDYVEVRRRLHIDTAMTDWINAELEAATAAVAACRESGQQDILQKAEERLNEATSMASAEVVRILGLNT